MTLPNITIQLPIKRLTQREIEIITFTAYGKTREEVSKILSISDRTVQEHLEHVYEKLNATNKTHAATIAVTLGLITPYRTEMA
jgi:DNA-binding CsgD family transcriptional regulator